MTNRLFRSRSDAVIGGVCGGFGQYLGIDPTWVRIFFVLLALGNGIGVLIYLLLWIIVPVEGAGTIASADTVRRGAEEIATRVGSLGAEMGTNLPRANARAGIWIGAALIVLGVVFFLQNLPIPMLRWINSDLLWPLLLVAGGLVLIWRQFKGA